MTQPHVDYEQLMIDALDGTITPRDNQMLCTYLDHHAEERAIFDRMTAFDRTMMATPAPAVPPTMAGQVMKAVSNASLAPASLTKSQPVLKAPQIAFLIGFPTILLLVCCLILVGVYVLISPNLSQIDLGAGFALLRVVADLVESIVVAVFVFLRALYSLPLTWVVTFGLALIVAGWLRVVAAIWLPQQRLTS